MAAMLLRLIWCVVALSAPNVAISACDRPDAKASAAGWEVRSTEDGWVATSNGYPGLKVPLFMASPGTPEIYEFTLLSRYDNRIALLQYYAGDPGSSYFVTLIFNAILDLEENRVIGEAPFTEDCMLAKWTWTEDTVQVDSDYGTDVFDLR